MLTQEEYNAKREARLQRLQNAAARAAKESESLLNTAHKMAEVIPFGQPILIGHYSENRDRNYRNRIESKFRKGYELYSRAQELQSRAENTSTAIMSDDPSALSQIEAKIAALEAKQEHMKTVNAAIRKNDRSMLTAIGCSDAQIERYFTEKDCFGGLGFARFELTNNNANIRRLKERAQIVAKKQAAPDTDKSIGDIKIEYRPSENRIRIYFPGKPDDNTRTELKRHGYRWTPTLGCWQAYYNYYAGQYVLDLAKKENSERTTL